MWVGGEGGVEGGSEGWVGGPLCEILNTPLLYCVCFLNFIVYIISKFASHLMWLRDPYNFPRTRVVWSDCFPLYSHNFCHHLPTDTILHFEMFNFNTTNDHFHCFKESIPGCRKQLAYQYPWEYVGITLHRQQRDKSHNKVHSNMHQVQVIYKYEK